MTRLSLILTTLALSTTAVAHGDAAWIQQDPRYVDRAGIHCCGEHDCMRVPRGAVVQVGDEWRVVGTSRVFKPGDPDLYRSAVDFDMWWCVRGGQVRCLFEPPGAM